MATRSRIAVKEGKVWKSVYVHWDGYPDGVGKELVDNYALPREITKLLDIGHRSSLIGDPEGETGYGDMCDEFETLLDLMDAFYQEDTVYLYQLDEVIDGEVIWKCFGKNENKEINLY